MVAAECLLVDSGQMVGDPWSLVVVVVNWLCVGDLVPNQVLSLGTVAVAVVVVH